MHLAARVVAVAGLHRHSRHLAVAWKPLHESARLQMGLRRKDTVVHATAASDYAVGRGNSQHNAGADPGLKKGGFKVIYEASKARNEA